MSENYNAGATNKDLVRMLISDVGGQDGTSFLFSDEEINAFLTLETDSVYDAASTALRTIAGNEAQVSKAIKLLDLSTNGPAVAKALMDLADRYEKKADDADDGSGGFEIATMAVDAPTRMAIIREELNL